MYKRERDINVAGCALAFCRLEFDGKWLQQVDDYYMIVELPDGGVELQNSEARCFQPEARMMKLIPNGTKIHVEGEVTSICACCQQYMLSLHGMVFWFGENHLKPYTISTQSL